MKKIFVFLILTTLVGCTHEMLEPIDLNEGIVPESLVINDISGLKVETTIVSDEVRMNARLPYTGTYRIKVRDISKKLISQERITANEGDNLLKVYVSSLPNDGYTIELTDENNKIMGITTIIVNN